MRDVELPRWFKLTFADVSLLDEAPKHVCAMMAVGRLVEGLLGECVAVGRGFGRCHRPADAPLTPVSHRETTHEIILHIYVISKSNANIILAKGIP